MTEQPDPANLRAASDAITRAVAELDQRDPEAAARHQEQRAATARITHETFGTTGTETVAVSWTDWTHHLPAEARAEMAAELAGLDGERRDVAVAAWRSTAEVYADPELLAALSPTSDDDDPTPPEVAAALARLRDRADVFEPKPAPTPERDGYTIGVYLPPGVRADVRDQLTDRIMDLVSSTIHEAEVVGLPGDPLGAVDGTARP